MPSRKPSRAPGALPIDSLAFAIRHAGALVASVVQGRNLTESYAQLQSTSPVWPDGTRGAIRDLAWGTLRDYGRGNPILAELVVKALPDEVHAILLVALHRLEQRPEQAHLIVDQTVDAVGSFAPGLKGVANGILRARLRQDDRFAALLQSREESCHRHPQWWIERVRASHPDTWKEVLAAGNGRPPMSVRVNPRRSSPAAVGAALQAQGTALQPLENGALLLDKPLPVARLPGFAEGALSVQDAGAQWAAQWLDAQHGHRVLDACAAPGGKTADILERADAHVLALDLDATRLQRVRDNLARLGLHAETRQADARRLHDWWDERPFDRILADVPCSASGVVRRHPDIKWLRRADDIRKFAAQQREILDALWHTLAPGGRMLYATCSVFREENQAQIETFAQQHPDVERLPLDGHLEQSLLPNAAHDGFFYALLGKRR